MKVGYWGGGNKGRKRGRGVEFHLPVALLKLTILKGWYNDTGEKASRCHLTGRDKGKRRAYGAHRRNYW